MNSKKIYRSIRDTFIHKTYSYQRISLIMNVIKYTFITFLILIIVLSAIIGYYDDFTWKNLIFIMTAIVALIVIIFIPLSFEINDKEVFICPHCLKNILVKNIKKIKCPYCDAEDLNFYHVLFGCPHCGDAIKRIFCPHCYHEIDLDKPLDINDLKEKRYE